ncbi:hypothetical protein OnM2_031031 [Erysiphe neolycopersici]|uniref:Uncharacterized protein n=1 Tax=Erysiphe neolycopersici TaxID=212602 RepID=A0A420HZ77_9PEZI|nr:hypothetical protein OnM2_031031 [Erysiphe neolycopersici]
MRGRTPDHRTICQTTVPYTFSSAENALERSFRAKSTLITFAKGNATSTRFHFESAFQEFHLHDHNTINSEIVPAEPTIQPVGNMAGQIPTLLDSTLAPFCGASAGAQFFMRLSIK